MITSGASGSRNDGESGRMLEELMFGGTLNFYGDYLIGSPEYSVRPNNGALVPGQHANMHSSAECLASTPPPVPIELRRQQSTELSISVSSVPIDPPSITSITPPYQTLSSLMNTATWQKIPKNCIECGLTF